MKKWLKRILKWGLIVFGVAVLIVTALIIWQWDTIVIMSSNDEIPEGESGAVPTAAAENSISPVKSGESDWPCWRGPAHDGKSLVKGIITDWEAGLEKKWEVNFLCSGKSSAVWSSPVIQGGRLVVMGRHDEKDAVYCLNSEDGSLIWESSYEAVAKSAYGKGSRATPWIKDGRVYTFGRSGDLICWNLENGDKIWHQNVGTDGGEEDQWGHSTSPFIINNLIVVKGGGSARTIAYDIENGTVKWKSGTGKPAYAAINLMKIEGKDVVLSFHGSGLSALDPEDGTEFWNTPWETPYGVNATTPVFENDMVFITSGYGTGGEVLRVSLEKAEVLWKNKEISSHHSDPYIINGFIYGYSGDSMQNKGKFKCLELATGFEKWSTNDMGWGTCTWVDGYLLCMDIKGGLYLMKPAPDKFDPVTSMPGALGPVKGAAWTIPVAAGGSLYLRFKQKLICYRLVM